MFDLLLDLPLFKGVSRERIADIVGKAKCHFIKYKAGEEIVSYGEHCTHLKFVLSGSVYATITSWDANFAIHQTFSAPDVLVADFLFGKETVYPCVCKALTDISVLQISKYDYLNILSLDQVLMLNYLNYLSRNAQKSLGIMALTSGDVEKRIAYWIVSLTRPSSRDIVLQGRHCDLATVFGTDAETFIDAVKRMSHEGLITYGDDFIKVVNRRDILTLISGPAE